MSAPSDNMPIAVSAARAKPLLLRHLPYFLGAAVLVALAATMQFDGYVLNILMEATTFSIAAPLCSPPHSRVGASCRIRTGPLAKAWKGMDITSLPPTPILPLAT